MRKSNTQKNLFYSMASLIVSVLQTLWFIPFISQKIGTEIYGYIAVILTIVNFSTVISIAITSMSSRYITIEMQKEDFKEANRYFNSILVAVIIAVSLLMVFFGVLTINLDNVMIIPETYLKDVQLLLVISGASFIITVLNTPFLAGLYYTNKLHIMYLFSIANYISKIVTPLVFLKFDFIPLWGMSLGGIVVDVFSFLYYFVSYKKYLPNIKIDFHTASKRHIERVLNSGIWISFTKAGNLLSSNVGTYMSNLLISAYMSGIYATILQLQTLISIMVTGIVSVFIPTMIKLHAEEDPLKLIQYTKKTIRFLSIPLGIISGGVMVFGSSFMTLWIGESYENYRLLIVLMIIGMPLSLPAEVLNQVNISINKVKVPAIATLLFGFLNIILIYLFCFIMEYGVYGIVLSQLIISISRGFLFFPIYTSYQLGNTVGLFFKDILLCLLITLITVLVSLTIIGFHYPTSFFYLILEALVVAVIVGSLGQLFKDGRIKHLKNKAKY